MLILYDYKELNLKVEKYLINKSLSGKKVEVTYKKKSKL